MSNFRLWVPSGWSVLNFLLLKNQALWLSRYKSCKKLETLSTIFFPRSHTHTTLPEENIPLPLLCWTETWGYKRGSYLKSLDLGSNLGVIMEKLYLINTYYTRSCIPLSILINKISLRSLLDG